MLNTTLDSIWLKDFWHNQKLAYMLFLLLLIPIAIAGSLEAQEAEVEIHILAEPGRIGASKDLVDMFQDTLAKLFEDSLPKKWSIVSVSQTRRGMRNARTFLKNKQISQNYIIAYVGEKEEGFQVKMKLMGLLELKDKKLYFGKDDKIDPDKLSWSLETKLLHGGVVNLYEAIVRDIPEKKLILVYCFRGKEQLRHELAQHLGRGLMKATMSDDKYSARPLRPERYRKECGRESSDQSRYGGYRGYSYIITGQVFDRPDGASAEDVKVRISIWVKEQQQNVPISFRVKSTETTSSVAKCIKDWWDIVVLEQDQVRPHRGEGETRCVKED